MDVDREMTEKMLASSTIDDPTETRILLQEIEASLPIPVKITPYGTKALHAQGLKEVGANQETQIEKILYSGDMGGILCSLPLGKETKDGKPTQVVISITHLHIDSKHPLAEKLKEYQKKRALHLAIANSGTRRSTTKFKRSKRGFGI